MLLAAIILTAAVAIAIVFALRMRGVPARLVREASALPTASATSGTAAPLRVAPRTAAAIPVPPSAPFNDAPDIDAEPMAAAGTAASPIPNSPPVAEVAPTWFAAFDSRSATLDDTARLRLIGDLGVIAKEWCVPLLAAAYAQEARPGHRQAALVALAACRSRAARPVFSMAVASDDPAARAIAADALVELQAPAPPTLHRVVERH